MNTQEETIKYLLRRVAHLEALEGTIQALEETNEAKCGYIKAANDRIGLLEKQLEELS